MRPNEDSYWHGGEYPFTFDVPESFPYEPPIVTCLTKIWHPNINLDGNVCLNILRKDWKPVLSINHIIFGLETLFLSPNPTDPLNKGNFDRTTFFWLNFNSLDAAVQMVNDLDGFITNVRNSLKGTYKFGAHSFPKMIN